MRAQGGCGISPKRWPTRRFCLRDGLAMGDARQSRKVAVVTGASSGIGQATAHALVQKGHVVYSAQRAGMIDDPKQLR
ncbi:MAG: SDR family NAD(P)-dependent oxidoreductase [Pseudomonadota bacterium]